MCKLSCETLLYIHEEYINPEKIYYMFNDIVTGYIIRLFLSTLVFQEKNVVKIQPNLSAH